MKKEKQEEVRAVKETTTLYYAKEKQNQEAKKIRR